MIRYARPSDHDVIAEVVSEAFGRPDEAALVVRLREAGDVLFELVSDEGGAVGGHILFSRLYADRYEMYAALAPLAVRPGLQRSGVGGALVRAKESITREAECPHNSHITRGPPLCVLSQGHHRLHP